MYDIIPSTRYSDFIQKTMRLDGNLWRFANRPYIYPIVNSNAKRTLMMTARQVEKSTTMAGRLLSKCCLNANKSYLYVSPTFRQSGVFSRKKIDEVFETSPLLKKNFYPGAKGFRVEEKRLKNHTTIYIRSAYHDADGIRGITSSLGIDFDEIQDLLLEVFPIIEACSMKYPDSQFFYAGTPKTMDNAIESKWQISTSCEWHVKCMGCGHWNMLSIDNVLLDKPGIWCVKCQKELDTLKGCWVKARESEMLGFRIPYILLHKPYIDWKDLFFKMRNYDTGALMNEVFGMSYDNGSKPLTREQLISACSLNRHMWEIPPESHKGYDFYAGIDWGGGNSGYTVLTIGYFDPSYNKYRIVYCKRYVGREAEPDNVSELIVKKLKEFNVNIVGADWGFGWDMNSKMRKMLPSSVTYVTFRHSIIKKFVAFDEAGNTYVTNRTEVMTELFNKIKNGFVEPFFWNEFEEFGKDYLNINAEYSDTLRQMKYIHTQPDDSFHSTLYSYLPFLIVTQQIPSTRYNAAEDEPNILSHRD